MDVPLSMTGVSVRSASGGAGAGRADLAPIDARPESAG